MQAVRIAGQVDAAGNLALYVTPCDGVRVEPYGNGFRIVTARD